MKQKINKVYLPLTNTTTNVNGATSKINASIRLQVHKNNWCQLFHTTNDKYIEVIIDDESCNDIQKMHLNRQYNKVF